MTLRKLIRKISSSRFTPDKVPEREGFAISFPATLERYSGAETIRNKAVVSMTCNLRLMFLTVGLT